MKFTMHGASGIIQIQATDYDSGFQTTVYVPQPIFEKALRTLLNLKNPKLTQAKELHNASFHLHVE